MAKSQMRKNIFAPKKDFKKEIDNNTKSYLSLFT